LIETLRRDAQAFGARVCFVHTGGPFGVFPLRDQLIPLADAARPRA
jgi:hypothetical protein